MRLKRVTETAPAIQLQMTPMIDIVFLLLVFFVMTFKIVIPEGDFQIHMAADGAGPSELEQPPEKIRVRLRASEDGALSGIEAEGKTLQSLAELRTLVMSLTNQVQGPDAETMGPEIEIDADAGLDYRHLMDTMTSVKGYVGSRGEMIQLVDRIKLVPPTKNRL